MRTLCRCLFVLTVAFAPAAAYAQAQSAPPQTYTITMSMGGMTVTAARDGSKESLEQLMPPGPNGPGMHIRQIYDFATHKYWTITFDGTPCVVSTYTSPALPGSFDPITGAEEVRQEMAKQKAAVLRTETVNGFTAKVYEAPVPEIKGKMRLWVEEKYGFPVKQVVVMGDGQERVGLEVKSVTFTKPAANLFVPPQGCRVQAGESSATGGHAEMEASVQASGEMKLGEEKPAPKKPAAAPASRPAATAAVTEVKAVSVTPTHYDGAYPPTFDFTFSVTATGPVEAKWVLVNQANIAWQSGTVVFEAAGTKEVKAQTKVGVAPGTHWEGAAHLEVLVGAVRTSSEPLKISADPKPRK